MHHGTCVTHVPWCMSGSLTRGGDENVPAIPGACGTQNFTYLVRGPWTQLKSLRNLAWTTIQPGLPGETHRPLHTGGLPSERRGSFLNKSIATYFQLSSLVVSKVVILTTFWSIRKYNKFLNYYVIINLSHVWPRIWSSCKLRVLNVSMYHVSVSLFIFVCAYVIIIVYTNRLY